MSQPIRGHVGNLGFPIGPQKNNLVEDVKIWLPLKVRLIPLSPFREKVVNVLSIHRPVRTYLFFDRPKNINLVEDVSILLPIKLRPIPYSCFGEKSKMSQPIRGQTRKLGRGCCSCSLSSFGKFHSAVSEKKWQLSQPIRGLGDHIFNGLKNINW